MPFAERKILHTKVMHTWRSVTNSHFKEVAKPLSDQELLDKFELLAPQTRVTLAIGNLFIRVVIKGSGGGE